MKPAVSVQDPVAGQLQALFDVLQQHPASEAALSAFLDLGVKHNRLDILEQHLSALAKRNKPSLRLCAILADIYERQRNFEKAAANIRGLFRCDGHKTEDMYNAAGRILPRTEQIADLQLCCQLLENGIREYPQSPGIVHNLIESIQMLGRHEEVLPIYRDAIKRMPADDTLYFGLGLVEMVTSNLSSGFEPYKHRFNLPRFKAETPYIPWPQWKGEPLAGKKIYVWAEQGVGDITMWGGLLPWLVEQGANVTCAVSRRMMPLFVRSFPAIAIVEKSLALTKTTHEAGYDYQCPMGNLMEYTLPHYKPSSRPAYLIADKEAVARKRAEYLALKPTAKKIVGLSWHSVVETGWRRNIPIELFHPLINDPEVVCIALQYNQQLGDTGHFNQQNTQQIHTDFSFIPIDDIDLWATQHAAMDEVLTIQNSSTHLAGALGTPTSLFLSTYGAWHWGNGSTSNYWYNSVTVYRQQPGQKWKSLIRESQLIQKDI
jgi:tetratricopeptide (TPR) repeat protein